MSLGISSAASEATTWRVSRTTASGTGLARLHSRRKQAASPLGRRPNDLRHAAVSTWLNGGVAPSQVAEWAGHSVEVLLRVYANCLDGGEQVALRRIATALERADPGAPVQDH